MRRAALALLLAVAASARAQDDDADVSESTAAAAGEPASAEHGVQAEAPAAGGAGTPTSGIGRGLPTKAPPGRPSPRGGGGGGGILAPVEGVTGGFTCVPGTPEKGSVIAGMFIAGSGPSHSSVSRSVLRVGRHVYVSGEPGLQTLDVSNPERMILTADWSPSSAKMNRAAAKGNVLYVTNWYPGEGLQIFDISRPAKPALVATMATPNYSWEADVTGNLLDLALGNETHSSIATYDLSNPRSPALIGQIEIPRRLIGNASRYGNYLYFTQDQFLYTYDSSDPARPKRLSEQSFKSLCGRTKVRGDYLYMLERKVVDGQEGGLRVFSLKDPAHPESVAFWPENEPKDMAFNGSLVVIPTGGTGVAVLDVSSPESPRVARTLNVEWPGTGHGGYPVTVDTAGDFAFVGATGGNNPKCATPACACYGGRVYSVRIR